MQNNETKWEEERQSANNLAELFFRDIDYGKKDKRNQEEVKDEVIKSASNLIFYKLKEVYQKGREEGRGENLSTTESITETLEIPKTIINALRLQTLEKMERVIKKLIENERDNGFEYINGEGLLQTLNKMKEHERHNIELIGDIVDTSKKPLENGEFLYTYKLKTRLITSIKVGEDKIEIKPQKGSWSQNTRNEIISFWKNEIRDKSEKTHQDIYNDFIKFVDSKKGEFYQNYKI